MNNYIYIFLNWFYFCIRYFTGEDTAKAVLTQEVENMEKTLHRAPTKEAASLTTE